MKAKHSTSQRISATRGRPAFTMIELLIVIAIIGILISMMYVVASGAIKKAREAATTALIQKLDALMDDRLKGFIRAADPNSPTFKQIIDARKQVLDSGGFIGVPRPVIAKVARQYFMRSNFPQRYQDFAPAVTASGPLAGVPTRILTDPTLIPEDANVNGILDAGEDTNGNGVLDGYIHAKHNSETESSALLYFALTKMPVFGAPPVGESEFATSEVRDTDGDGLLEFVDGWGRPLRFYRWPTRLLKPNGIRGLDNQFGAAGVDDDGNGITDGNDLMEFGKVNTDDINVPASQRAIAALLIDGLPSGPVIAGQWDSLSEDPDDPYGAISTEIKRQFQQTPPGVTPINVLTMPNGYNEGFFPTIDTYSTPLIVSAGADGDFGLYPPYLLEDVNGNGVLDAGEDTNGNGFLNYGVLAQVIHGPAGPYDITSSVQSTTTDVISALTDNITNRNRRAGRGK